MNEQETLEKICSFYVSDWHMVTMLLPYVSKQVEKNINVETMFQKDVEKNVTELLGKLKISNAEEILKIDWKAKELVKYKEEEKQLEEGAKLSKETIMIVGGTNEYINAVNTNIHNYVTKNIKKLVTQRRKIKVINCYEIMQFNGKMDTILDMHDKVLNTSGEKEIEEIFEGYQRKEENMEKAN